MAHGLTMHWDEFEQGRYGIALVRAYNNAPPGSPAETDYEERLEAQYVVGGLTSKTLYLVDGRYFLRDESSDGWVWEEDHQEEKHIIEEVDSIRHAFPLREMVNQHEFLALYAGDRKNQDIARLRGEIQRLYGGGRLDNRPAFGDPVHDTAFVFDGEALQYMEVEGSDKETVLEDVVEEFPLMEPTRVSGILDGL